MGRTTATKIVIGLLIYYFLFFLILWGIIGAKTEMRTTTTLSYNGVAYDTDELLDIKEADGFCDEPRANGEVFGFNNACQDTNGVIGEQYCDDLNPHGCTWENETAWWGLVELGETCTGQVNWSSLGTEDPDTHANNMCRYSEVLYNDTLCYLLDCTWTDYSEVTDNIDAVESSVGIWDAVTYASGFDADLGLPQFNFIASFFLFWIEGILLFAAIIMFFIGD